MIDESSVKLEGWRDSSEEVISTPPEGRARAANLRPRDVRPSPQLHADTQGAESPHRTSPSTPTRSARQMLEAVKSVKSTVSDRLSPLKGQKKGSGKVGRNKD